MTVDIWWREQPCGACGQIVEWAYVDHLCGEKWCLGHLGPPCPVTGDYHDVTTSRQETP